MKDKQTLDDVVAGALVAFYRKLTDGGIPPETAATLTNSYLTSYMTLLGSNAAAVANVAVGVITALGSAK